MSKNLSDYKEKISGCVELLFSITALMGFILYGLHWVYFTWQPFVHAPIFFSICFLGSYIYCFKWLLDGNGIASFIDLFSSFKGLFTFLKIAVTNFIISTAIATWLIIMTAALFSDWRAPDCNAAISARFC